ncbi:MAG TPA: response regulator [Steroidobacteraceae bacterium]|nr:response regulator [Steroidobacteraceae bacterium]
MFSSSAAMIGADGRLIAWNDGFEREFAAVPDAVARGAEFSVLVAAALKREGLLRDAPRSAAGMVERSFDYGVAGRVVRVEESRTGGGAWFRTARLQGRSDANDATDAPGESPSGRSIGRIAHDLNNLLTAMIGHADSMLGVAPADSPAARCAAAINSCVDQCAALTRRLAECALAMDGSLSMRAAPAAALLPAENLAAAAAAAATAAPAPRAPARTILLVDDNQLVRESVAASLRSMNFRVLAADGGEAALRLLEGPESIDLLFTDVVMPNGPSGPELAARARRRRPSLKVLFTSGFPSGALGTGTSLARTEQFLMKPYGLEELVAALERLLPP